MPLCWTGLAPHPPILLPALGGGRARQAFQTCERFDALGQSILSQRPDLLVLLSPHTPIPLLGSFGWSQAQLRGDFSKFGFPEITVTAQGAPDAFRCLKDLCPWLQSLPSDSLDHGVTVPLWFLQQSGLQSAVLALGLSRDPQERAGLAQALRTLSQGPERWAVLASGDMSHCRGAESPYGYHPHGERFDQAFATLVARGAYDQIEEHTRPWRAEAREDVFLTSQTAWEVAAYRPHGRAWLGMEAPFGVGYGLAIFFQEGDD